MDTTLMVGAVTTAIISTLVVVPASWHFARHVVFRHWEVVVATLMHLAGVVQAGILIYAVSLGTSDTSLQNKVVFWGTCGIGILPWSLMALGWTNALHPIKGVRLWYAVPVLGGLVVGIIYLVTAASDDDGLNDVLTTVATVIMLVPLGMLILTRVLRRYKRHEGVRDMFLITLVFQLVLVPGFHHIEPGTRDFFVILFAIAQPILLGRVLFGLWWFRHAVFARYPWQFYFATVEDLDKLPGGVKLFLHVVEEYCDGIDVPALQRELELWITNESLYAMKLHNRVGPKYADMALHVRELMYGTADRVHEHVYPEKVRVACIDHMARTYQHHLLNQRVRKQLCLVLANSRAVDLDEMRKRTRRQEAAKEEGTGWWQKLRQRGRALKMARDSTLEMELVPDRETIELPGNSDSSDDSSPTTTTHRFDTPSLTRRVNDDGTVTLQASASDIDTEASESGTSSPWGHDENDWSDENLHSSSDDNVLDYDNEYGDESADEVEDYVDADEEVITYASLSDFRHEYQT